MADPFSITWLVLWAVYLFGIYTPSARRFRRSRVTENRTGLGDALLDFTVFFAWQVFPLVHIFSDWLDFADYALPAWTGWAGAAILLLAVALLFMAYRALGASWSPKIDVRQDQKLVTSGIYTRIRHPIYAGIWLWALAQPLLLHNWIAGAGMLATFLPLYLTRVPREEAMMLSYFGERYRAYMGRTGRIFPKIG
jgi:protein-S-isoprenylcysteine O-methyltransferase Ste14